MTAAWGNSGYNGSNWAAATTTSGWGGASWVTMSGTYNYGNFGVSMGCRRRMGS